MRRGQYGCALRAALLTGAALALPAMTAQAQQAQAQQAQEQRIGFDIPAQDLNGAVLAFARQARIQVFYDVGKVQGLRSPGVSGRLTPPEALRLLLAGTGLSYRFDGSGSVTLETLDGQGGLTLSPVTVEGARSPETATGPVAGFVATRGATATKTDTPLIETPQTINVVTRDQMEAQGAQSIAAALRYTPGVTPAFGDSDSRVESFQSRGFFLRDHLDGARVPFGAYSVTLPRIEPYGLERLEVLKGPGSVLYGQSTPGGILNQVTKRPTAEALNEVQFQTGSHERLQGGFDFSRALDADKTLLYRLTGLVRDTDGRTDFSYDKRRFIAPSFTWQPDEDTSLTLLSHYQHDETISDYAALPARGTLYGNANGPLPTSRYSGEPGADGFERDQYAIGYALEHRFNDDLTLRQNAKYTDVSVTANATPGFALAADDRTYSRVASRGDGEASTINIDTSIVGRFDSGALDHTALAGFDYLRLNDEYRFASNITAAIDLYNPVYGATPRPALIPRLHHDQEMDQIGFYLQDQIKLDRWVFTLGGRYDIADSTTRSVMANTATEQKDEKFTWRAGVNYLFDNGLAPYASYATSFEPTAGTSFAGTPFQPTTGEQFEVGLKYQPPRSNSFASIALYSLTQQNVLTPDPDPTHVGFSTQTGEAEVRGIDLDVKLNLAAGFDLLLGYAYTDSEVTKDNPNALGVSNIGNPLPRTPEHQALAWADYTLQGGALGGLGIGGGVRYVGASYSDSAASLRIPSFVLVDAALRYDLGRLDGAFDGLALTVNAMNLFDKEYVAYCGSVAQCYYGQSRTLYATVTYRW